MSYPINKNINPATIQNYPQSMTSGPNGLPLDTDKVTQTIASNSALKPPSDSPLETLGITVAAMPAIYYGVNKFNKACRGDYEKSVLGKLGHWGDKIQGVLPESFTTAFGKAYSSTINFVDTKIIKNVSILNSFFHNKSKPSSSMVLSISGGTQTELSTHIASLLKEYTEDGKNVERLAKLKELGVDGLQGIEALSKTCHTEDGMDQVTKICEGLVKEESFATKRALGIPFSEKLFKEKKYITEILPFTKKVLCPENNFSELLNKLNALRGKGKGIAKTALGKFFSRFSIRSMEGLVNGNTAGVFGLFMGAYFVGEAIKKAIHAPKGEKGKTFAEHNIYNLGWYLTMPLGMSIMHGVGGLQYIGMSKDQVTAYRKRFEAFDEKVKLGQLTTEQYKTEVKTLKEMLKGETALKTAKSTGGKFIVGLKNILHKPLKTIGRIVTVGLETVRPLKQAGIMGKIKQIPYYLKKGAGWPMRFGLFMFLIAPPLGKLGAKFSHLVFGKPTHSVLDEGKEEAGKGKATPSEIQQMASQLQAQPMGQTTAQEPQSVMQPVNSTQNAARQTVASEPYKAQNMITMYSQKPTAPAEPARGYVPSQEAAQFDSSEFEQTSADDEKVKAALRKAEIAERRANSF